MTPKTIIFMGPQGSGKGTQVKLLIEKLQAASEQPVVDIETGKIFRGLAAEGSFAGERVKELIEAGNLVPDVFTNALWIADLSSCITLDAHVVFDGVPRTLVQAAVVDEMNEFFARTNVSVVNLQVPEDVVVKRMLERGRADDTSESIRVRLDSYQQKTVAVLEHYRSVEFATVYDLDGTQTPGDVHSAICAVLGVE